MLQSDWLSYFNTITHKHAMLEVVHVMTTFSDVSRKIFKYYWIITFLRKERELLVTRHKNLKIFQWTNECLCTILQVSNTVQSTQFFKRSGVKNYNKNWLDIVYIWKKFSVVRSLLNNNNYLLGISKRWYLIWPFAASAIAL